MFAGDSARERVWHTDEFAESRQRGFHKALADAKRVETTDADVYRAARRWLDAYHRRAAADDSRTGSTGVRRAAVMIGAARRLPDA